ncbi:peptidase domain-containing ABC transporter [Micromonospora sediminimaris]|uniref:NHLP family bacteriocin export ABC transporter peptidase/permease/ATPase n=1 Tax=Micromonospora sediminimaris TaxID=547162 RepID=A0A9W5XKM7_9ACTN|nr:peptidase domain-containing ABC transporter [Micromonospora sediminimaris]GIJ32868.1 NHLP family bacteriocin export ABC transporter peptidase/permease/ATPase [Micromonospora sediminimaris]SFD05023.1 ABC-type bacteriocin/lantibiotic exporter, contains an N-terminal double-glycine peptidase domain [Micromonospora sediminimaris]
MSTLDERGQVEQPTPPPTEFTNRRQRFRREAVRNYGLTRETGEPVDLRWRARPGLGFLRDLRWRNLRAALAHRRNRVPVVLQSQMSDCGAAALAMVLAYFGQPVPLDALRTETDTGRDGVAARSMLAAARRRGLVARGVRVSIGGLRNLPPATILFWNFVHFVVLERVTDSHIYVVDPSFGRRKVSLAEAGKAFTGVALEFHPPIGGADPRRAAGRHALGAARMPYATRFFPRTSAWLPLVLTSVALTLCSLVVPIASSYVVDWASRPGEPASVWLFVAAPLVLFAMYFWMQTARRMALLSIQTLADKSVTLGTVQHLVSLPFDYFARRHTGDLAIRVRTSNAVRQVLTGSALSAVLDGVLVLVYGWLVVIADPRLGTLVLALAVVQVGVLAVSWRRQEYLTAALLEAQARAQTELFQLLDGVPTLKASGLEGAAAENWSHTFAAEVNARTSSRRFLAVCEAASTAIQFLAPLTVLAAGLVLLDRGEISLSRVVGFSALAMGMFVPLASLTQTGLQVAGLRATLTRLADILDARPEAGPDAVVPARVTGAVRLDAVRFAYPGTRTPAVADIDFEIVPGQFTLVVGASGSGKSTLAMLLAGLYLPSAGTVQLDGRPFEQLDRPAVRRSMAYVRQDARLFAGTIRENIALGRPECTLDDVIAAARLAEVHDDIDAMPMRYETLLGAAGAGLSGGQIQRISLARALVRGCDLLILDEATSALDRLTEDRIVTNLRGTGRTLVVVAHRLSHPEAADQILVMSDGRIVQRGRHESLIAEDGPYRRLVGAAP